MLGKVGGQDQGVNPKCLDPRDDIEIAAVPTGGWTYDESPVKGYGGKSGFVCWGP